MEKNIVKFNDSRLIFNKVERKNEFFFFSIKDGERCGKLTVRDDNNPDSFLEDLIAISKEFSNIVNTWEDGNGEFLNDLKNPHIVWE